MLKVFVESFLWSAVMVALIFWPAGTWAYPGGWAFVIMFFGGGWAIMAWMFAYSPTLLSRRLGLPWQSGQMLWDRVFIVFIMLLFFTWLPFMSWDAARTGFTAVPLFLQLLGVVAVMSYGFIAWLAFRENAFAAPVVTIQEGQIVVDSGPYAVVRHPMYGAGLLFFLGLPLLMGSWWGLIFSAVFIVALAWRARREEEALLAALPDYADYAVRVRWRFIPRLW